MLLGVRAALILSDDARHRGIRKFREKVMRMSGRGKVFHHSESEEVVLCLGLLVERLWQIKTDQGRGGNNGNNNYNSEYEPFFGPYLRSIPTEYPTFLTYWSRKTRDRESIIEGFGASQPR